MAREDLQLERQRDNQQWLLDYLIKETGREQNFEYPGRRFPAEVRNYQMIPRVLFRYGSDQEELARRAEEQGATQTAARLYFSATQTYRHAQHSIFKDNDSEKQYLYERMTTCFDRVLALSSARLERVEIDWDNDRLSGILHLCGGEKPRPTVIFCPGMDMTKEAFPVPWDNPFTERGINLLSIDGPGQGASNLRKIRVTHDNYERAVSRFVDYLESRSEVDAHRIAVSGFSMGSFWACRAAATDERIKAIATAAACYGDKTFIFEQASPRFKQVFMYMSGVHDEVEFNELATRLTLNGFAERIRCPSLQVVGEYDPLCPLEEVEGVFERLGGPRELWVTEDDFHTPFDVSLDHFGGLSVYPFLADWLRTALKGEVESGRHRRVLVRMKGGAGPYDREVAGFQLPDR